MWEFEFGYLGLFLSAFLAATILPVASEVFLLAMLKLGFDPILCLILATLGNSLGAILNYFIGYIGNPKWLNKIGSGDQFLQMPVSDFPAKGFYNLQIKQGNFQSNQQIIYMPAN